MNLQPVNDYAHNCGVTTEAVRKAARAGHLTIKDGMVDADSRAGRQYHESHARQRRQAQHKKTRTVKRVSDDYLSRDKPSKPAAQSDESYSEAERREKIANADLKEQRLARERGDLVQRTDVEAVFNRLIAVLTQQTLAIPQRCSPDLCAHLGIDDHEKVIAAEKYLDAEIRRGVEQQKLLMLDWLKEHENAEEANDEP